MSTLHAEGFIIVTYRAIDGARIRRKYKTLKGAQRFAHSFVGARPSLGRGYAVSDDGIGKVTVHNATLTEIFPDAC